MTWPSARSGGGGGGRGSGTLRKSAAIRIELPPRSAMLARAKSYIEEHLGDERLSPGTVAQGIYISKRYLHLLFEDEAVSVSQYILARRMAVSGQLLRDARLASLTVADIACAMGFKDASHFGRAFKTNYGLTPSAYRTTTGQLTSRS